MGATDPAQGAGASNPAQAEAKGKGKAVPEDVSMGEEDTSSDEETGAEDDVCCVNPFPHPVFPPIVESQVFYNHYMNEWLLITLSLPLGSRNAYATIPPRFPPRGFTTIQCIFVWYRLHVENNRVALN